MPSGQMWDGPSEIPESMLQEVVTTIETAAFIKEHSANNAGKPWFVCASYCRPHPPFAVPSRFHKKYEGRVPNRWIEEDDTAVFEDYAATVRAIHHEDRMDTVQNLRAREAYYACIDFVDDCIGRLLRDLERDGLLENTIIIYTSDHGEMNGHHGMWNKAQHYENAVRSPLIMCGSGIPKGLRIEKMVGLFDIMPTLMELCGLKPPKDIDGVSLLPLLKGNDQFVPHSHIITEYLGITAVDRANYNKSSSRPYPSFRAVITDRYKYSEPYETDERRPTLFDLSLDPAELSNKHGLQEYAGVERELKKLLDSKYTMDEWVKIAAKDAERAKQFRDGVRPSMPNQYMLGDGRIFDAEKGLYDVRWLQTSSDSKYGGFIPQRYY
jgi:choline-sulfatase